MSLELWAIRPEVFVFTEPSVIRRGELRSLKCFERDKILSCQFHMMNLEETPTKFLLADIKRHVTTYRFAEFQIPDSIFQINVVDCY